MKTKMIFLVLLILFVVAAIGFSLQESKAQDNAGEQTRTPGTTNILGTVYFISSNNSGCECMKKRSGEMSATIDNLIEIDSELDKKIEIKDIPFFENRKEAESILEKYQLQFAPALMLLDHSGNILFKASYDFDDHQAQVFIKKIADLLGEIK